MPLGLRVWDYMVDVAFLLDIFANFRTAYHQEDGGVELDANKIRTHYMHGAFALDLIASVPVDWFLPGGAGSAIGAAKARTLSTGNGGGRGLGH